VMQFTGAAANRWYFRIALGAMSEKGRGIAMILDDLFAFAAQEFVEGRFNVTVQATVTTNNTDGLQTTTNTATVQPALSLSYTPPQEVNIGGIRRLFPASFQGELTITAPYVFVLHGSPIYSIEWQGHAFAANVDGTTNIVYGVAGQQFITISLCDLFRSGVIQ